MPLKIINSDTQYTVQYTFFSLSDYVAATANYVKYISNNKYQITLKHMPAHELKVGKDIYLFVLICEGISLPET